LAEDFDLKSIDPQYNQSHGIVYRITGTPNPALFSEIP